MDQFKELESEVRRLRAIQLDINKKLSAGAFKVPIHLGLGHETLAVSCVAALGANDSIFLTHRNIHFQIALGASLEDLENEYLLNRNGLANGKLGSMNLMNPKKRNIYTSNILGNNLAVALGSGLASSIRNSGDITWVISGDGAIEEGVFFESLLLSASLSLPIIYVVENNNWSLATKISDRRVPIDLKGLTNSVGIEYTHLQGNNLSEYLGDFQRIRESVKNSKMPQLIEVQVESLGGYIADSGTTSERYINYHAGAVRIQHCTNGILVNNSSDPVFNLFEGEPGS
jgi:TPP-dependent pyruvate/acetoin dehydrogenase alpha subunit